MFKIVDENEQKLQEPDPTGDREQGCYTTAKKANDGTLFDVHALNSYCQGELGLALVPEGENDEDENDSWQLQSIKRNQSYKKDKSVPGFISLDNVSM